MFDTAFVLIVVAALLVVVGFCQPLAAYLKLPLPVLLGVVGVALGGFPAVLSELGWSAGSDPFADIFVELPVSSATFIYVFLPLLVFEAGIVTDVRRTLQDAAPILLLAIVATLITTGVIGLALWPVAGGLSVARRRCRNHRSCRGYRDLSRCRRPGALDPPCRRRSVAQRRSGDRAVRGFTRNARQRAGAGNRLRAARIFLVVRRRWRTGIVSRPGAARGDPVGSRRSAGGSDLNPGDRLRRLYRRRAPLSRIGCGRSARVRPDDQRARPFP